MIHEEILGAQRSARDGGNCSRGADSGKGGLGGIRTTLFVYPAVTLLSMCNNPADERGTPTVASRISVKNQRTVEAVTMPAQPGMAFCKPAAMP